MTILFNDTFSSGTLLHEHVPDTVFGAYAWDDVYGCTIATGDVSYPATAPDDVGNPAIAHAGATAFDTSMSLTFTTNTSLSSYIDGRWITGVAVAYSNLGSLGFELRTEPASATIQIFVDGVGTTVSLSANTTYTATMSITEVVNGANLDAHISVTVNGVTADAVIASMPAGGLPTSTTLYLGQGTKVSAISMTGETAAAGGTATVALTSPSPTLSAAGTVTGPGAATLALTSPAITLSAAGSTGSIVLLLHGDGTDGSTVVTDSSPNAMSVTTVTGTTLSTTSPKYGTASISFNGTTGGLTIPDNALFDFGTDSFTIEAWVFPNNKDNDQTIFEQRFSGPTDTSVMLYITGGNLVASVRTDGVVRQIFFSTIDYIAVWKHTALVRTPTNIYLYVDGLLKGSEVAPGTVTASAGDFKIGHGAVGVFNGKIDEFRITKGAALYTSAFTPSAEAFPTPNGIPGAFLTCPRAELVAAGTVGEVPPASATFALTAPVTTASSWGGGMFAGTAASPLLSAEAHDASRDRYANLRAPSPSLTAFAGAALLSGPPAPTLVSAATSTALASAALRAPKIALTASATVASIIRAGLTSPMQLAVGYAGAVIRVMEPGRPTLSASGTTGSIGRAQLECPLFELTASGTAQNYGSAHLIAPSPQLGRTMQAWLVAPSAKLTAIGSAVVTATYEAYAVNLKHTADTPDEVTRYTNFPFTHVVRYKNSYYGANNTGLFLLEGTTDEATPIPWSVKTAMTDFKSPVKKTVASAYFAGRFGPASTVALHAGEDVPNTYSFSTPRDHLAQNHRQVFGKGVKERYYALGASGTDVVELDAVELNVVNTTRRI